MNVRRCAALGLTGAALALPLSWGAPALADPSHSFPITLVCDGVTYQTVGEGNGDFTPVHDLNSNKVFVPHAFGPFTGTIYDDHGNVVDSETDPAQTQGSGKQPNDMSCTYSFTWVSDGSDPGFPAGYSFVGAGSVTGQVAGH
jgi:hypothetical protein